MCGRPDADALYTSAVPGDGLPIPFYESYGFERTGDMVGDQVVLRLMLEPTRVRVARMVDWDWNRVVFDHVKISVRDAAESKRFYTTVLATLEIPPLWESEKGAQFANLVVYESSEWSGPNHIAFVAETREKVDAFHRAGIEAGFRDNGPPGVREQYSSDEGGRYYAAFLFDPDGNNVEAVCREF